MDSFVFNNFKKRLMEGDVPDRDIWKFYPVNKNFIDDNKNFIKYIKQTSDIELINKTDSIDKYISKINDIKYVYKTMYKVDVPMEPLYVNIDNFDVFNDQNPNNAHLKDIFLDKNGRYFRPGGTKWVLKDNGEMEEEIIPRGFYFVKTAEELLWCANKVNGTEYDNTINIVLGDNIGRSNEDSNPNLIDILNSENNNYKLIDFSIGSNPAQPFNGIFYGNGFKIWNIILECNNEVNGLIGYLGYDGIISTIDIDGTNVLKCNKKINIDHLIKSGSDINAGLLCGKNNGKIEYVRVLNNVLVTQFYPEIYSMSNKTDENLASGNGNAYPFYPDYYCYNSPGNIIPYIGYFNEGVAATFSGFYEIGSGGVNLTYWNTKNNFAEVRSNAGKISPMEWYYWIGATNADESYSYTHFTDPRYRTNVLWYDGNLVSYVNEMYGFKMAQKSDIGIVLENEITMDRYLGEWFRNTKYVDYFNKSIKLSQQNRQAYYVSPLVGMNNSVIDNVYEDCKLYTSGTFVGFMGGLAGKQANGKITNSVINVSSYDLIDKNITEDKPNNFYLRNYLSNEAYTFTKKSIKNIAGLFGSCVVGNLNSLELDTVSAYFYNHNNIIFDMKTNSTASDISTPIYDDYYFMNRYGTFAAIVEYNSSNISDLWRSLDEANNPQKRSIVVKNSIFGYNENLDNTSYSRYIPETAQSAIYERFSGCTPFGSSKLNNRFINGVASPLFAEIKPTYIQTPSIISSPFYNVSTITAKEENHLEKPDPDLIPPATILGNLGLTGTLKADYILRNGLFTIDQNLATFNSDPMIYTINAEVDLPGISNSPTSGIFNLSGQVTKLPFDNYKEQGYAGGIVDRLNNTACKNFDLNIQKIASKLIYWDKSQVIDNFKSNENNVFTTITVPSAANIPNLKFEKNSPDVLIVDDYNGNKIRNSYYYFGSDLELVPTINDNIEEDIITNYNTLIMEFENTMYDGETKLGSDMISVAGHRLGNCVEKIRIEIKEDAFNYSPFTTASVSDEYIQNNIKVSAYINNSNGNGTQFPLGWHSAKYYNNSALPFYPYDGGREDLINKKFGGFKDISGRDNYGLFAVKVDFDEASEQNDLYFMIPFINTEYISANDKTVQDHPNMSRQPPYNTWFGTYVITHKTGVGDDRTYDNLSMAKFKAWGFTHEGDEAYNLNELSERLKIFRALKYISANVTTDFRFFKGHDANNQDIYYDENEYPTDLETNKLLTAYKMSADSETNKYKFVDISGNLTDDINEAITGYISGGTTHSTVRVNTSQYIEIENQGRIFRYQYYPEELFTNPLSSLPPVTENIYMSAVKLTNIPSAEWNWQTWIRDCPLDNTSYNFEYRGQNYVYPLASGKQYTVPKRWNDLDCVGEFYNALASSNEYNDPGLTIAGPQDYGFENDIFTNGNPPPHFKDDAISANYKNASSINRENNDIVDYYRYTYEKAETEIKDISARCLNVPVKFDYLNNKCGFWFTSKDLNKNKGMPVSGDIEFNDDVNYYGNILFYGKTLSEISLLNKCLKTSNSYEVSGFSANDLEGFYITDNTDNPVMYIDVGLGECTDGTSWSFSSYPSTSSDDPKELNNCSGLLLEIE